MTTTLHVLSFAVLLAIFVIVPVFVGKGLLPLSRVPIEGARDAVDPVFAASVQGQHRRERISGS